MRLMQRLAVVVAGFALVGLTACPAPVDAPYGAVLAEMDDVELTWDSSAAGAADYWFLVRADFLVYDSETNDPLNNVNIEILSGYPGIYILPTGVINVETCPEGDQQWQQYCADEGQTWADLTGSFNDALKPLYYKGYTNANGVESVWLWIEDMPEDENGDAGDTQVWATIGVDSTYLAITVAGN